MAACGSIARQRFDAHDEAQSSHHIGVMNVARPPWFGRIVADDGAFLAAINWLNGAVHIHDVGFGEKRLDTRL